MIPLRWQAKGVIIGTYGDEEVLSISKGRAYGFEVLAQEKNIKGFNVILSYTFVRSEFQDYWGTYIPSAWDNKHILNLTVSKTFKRNWDIGAKWRFVGSSPYTPYDEEKSSIRPAWDSRNFPLFSISASLIHFVLVTLTSWTSGLIRNIILKSGR